MRTAKRSAALSFVSGTSAQPLLYRTVDGALKAAVFEAGNRAALVVPSQSIRWTYAEFDREVERTARGMVACGLKPGERIGIWAPNCAEWVLTLFGAARAGLILVNINPAYRSAELEFALRKVGCRALVFAPRFKSSDYAAMLLSLMPEIADAAPGRLASAALPELRLLVQLGGESRGGILSFGELLARGSGLDDARLGRADVSDGGLAARLEHGSDRHRKLGDRHRDDHELGSGDRSFEARRRNDGGARNRGRQRIRVAVPAGDLVATTLRRQGDRGAHQAGSDHGNPHGATLRTAARCSDGVSAGAAASTRPAGRRGRVTGVRSDVDRAMFRSARTDAPRARRPPRPGTR